MNERQLRIRVQSCVYDYAGKLNWQPAPNEPETPIVKIESFSQRRITTSAEGFVLTLSDGSEFQVVITKSKL